MTPRSLALPSRAQLHEQLRYLTVTERLAARLDGVEAALHALDTAIRLSAEEQRAYVDAAEARLLALIDAWRAEWLGGAP